MLFATKFSCVLDTAVAVILMGSPKRTRRDQQVAYTNEPVMGGKLLNILANLLGNSRKNQGTSANASQIIGV